MYVCMCIYIYVHGQLKGLVLHILKKPCALPGALLGTGMPCAPGRGHFDPTRAQHTPHQAQHPFGGQVVCVTLIPLLKAPK